MADLAKVQRLLAGVRPPGAEEPEPESDEERRQVVRRAWVAQWRLARPLPPPLDRLSPQGLAAFRARRARS